MKRRDMECIGCGKKLTGRQTKYCSIPCKRLAYHNKNKPAREQLVYLNSKIRGELNNIRKAEKNLRKLKRKVEVLMVKRVQLRFLINQRKDG